MSKTDNTVFIVLHVVAWIIFVGLSIEAGGLLVNFIFSVYNPEMLPKLYQKLDLREMYERSTMAYYSMYSFILVISVLKAVMFYHVITLLSGLKLNNPFTLPVSKQIYTISYYTLSIGLLSYIARQSAQWLQHRGIDTANLNAFWADSQAFVLMAAVIYVIAVIFKKGIELQDEIDLTV
ncbi:MAG: DUF2975 domain-containing protein [Weeksellaceae bacterium]|nr:DUF2975 domain-containing protein [Weeksellaceae bacterium]